MLNFTSPEHTLARSIFQAKLRLVQPKAYMSFEKLKQSQILSQEELWKLNWNRRKMLVEHCAQNIPFYRDKFREIGFEAGDLKCEDDWARLPILEKSDIREFSKKIVNPKLRLSDLPVATTGGTTGLPLKTYNDPAVHLSSMSWRMLGWWGLHPSDNSGYLYRAIPTGLRKRLIDFALFPTRRAYLSASAMTLQEMHTFYESICSAKIKYLVGYVGALEVFSRYCEEMKLKLPYLEAVWTTASPLSQNSRHYMEKVFNCPIYTQYGSCEFYWIAAECKQQNGLHIGIDVRHVEIISDTIDEETGFGDLAITDLQNYAFPLLKYRIGDRGRMLKIQCGCGLGFPLMDYVRGRVTDNIKLGNGTLIPGEYWTTIFDDFTDIISAFQVHQYSDLSIEVRYVSDNPNDAAMAAELVKSNLILKAGESLKIKMVKTDEIAQRSGKIQFVTSDAD